MSSYVIADEPRPGPLGNYVVRPSAPLLAMMLGGAWLAWPWFIVNAIALGSPTRRREIAMVAIALAGTALLAVVALALVDAGIIHTETQARLAGLVIRTWKLGMACAVYTVQARTFHVFEYYGGAVRSPRVVLIAGLFLRGAVVGLVDSTLWRIIVGGDLVSLVRGGLS
jgi:hypothetical protein